jgi:hypothetical protein
MGKPEGKRLLGWCRYRSEDNIEMDLQEIGWWIEGGLWTGLIWLSGSG